MTLDVFTNLQKVLRTSKYLVEKSGALSPKTQSGGEATI